MSEVVVLGSANTDLSVRVDRLPRPHETVTDGELMVSYGGKGANQALAALKAGAGVTLLAKIGKDGHGNLLYDHLIQCGFVKEGLVRDPEAPAGVALISVDKAGNNQIAVAPGSNKRFTVEDLRAVKPLMEGASLLLIQFETPMSTVEYALRLAKARGMTTILNPAPYAPLSPEIYSSIDILTPNEREAADLTGMKVETVEEAKKAALLLRSRGCGTVIVTLGAQGTLLSHGESVEHYAAFPVHPIDSVAAGDAFNGSLAAALAEGKSLSEAVRFANAAGALSTTKRGAQESLPTRREIDQLLRSGRRG